MIRASSVTMAISNSIALAQDGISLSTSPGTVLDGLVSITNSSMDVFSKYLTDTPTDTDEYAYFASMLESLTTGTMESPSTHSLAMDGINHAVGRSLATHMGAVRNVIMPLCIDYSELVIKGMS